MRKKKSGAAVAAERKDAYQNFWSLYRPDRHRMGIELYERIKIKHYSARTIYGITDTIRRFESQHGDTHGYFMCFVQADKRYLIAVIVDESGYIKYFSGIDKHTQKMRN